MQQDITVDSFLEHYGVKGMKWGVRKAASSLAGDKKKLIRTAQVGLAGVAVAKAAKPFVTRDATNTVQGYGIRGYNARKIDNKLQKQGKAKSTKQLTPQEAKKLDRRIKRRTYADLVARGTVETGVILGARKVAMNALKSDPKTAQMIDVGAKFMTTAVVLGRATQLKGVSDSYALDRKLEKKRNK